MRRIAVILSVIIYLLNLAGNSLYIDYMMGQSGIKQQIAIDAGNYDAKDLVEVKIPFKSPYYSSTPGFERYYGEVNAGGHYYTYVERKVGNDTIYLLCLPDIQKSELSKIKTTLVKNTGAVEHSGDSKEQKSPLPKKVLSEYDEYLYSCTVKASGMKKEKRFFSYNCMLIDGFQQAFIKPPANIA